MSDELLQRWNRQQNSSARESTAGLTGGRFIVGSEIK